MAFYGDFNGNFTVIFHGMSWDLPSGNDEQFANLKPWPSRIVDLPSYNMVDLSSSQPGKLLPEGNRIYPSGYGD